jgi:subtilisin family serine protease
MMNHRDGTAARAVLAVLFGLAACDGASPATGPADAAGPRLGPEAAARIGAGVAEAVSGAQGARVMVALDPSRVALGSGGEVVGGTLVHGVAELVDGFLERVGTEELRVVRRFVAVPAVAATVTSDAALARLAADPAVVRVDLDVGGTGGLSFSVQQVGADIRHGRGNDGAGVAVAVLDSGVDTGHPALAGRVVHQACFGLGPGGAGFCPDGTARQTGPGSAMDDAGHGTHVTGIVAASGEGGAAGMAPGADIVALKVMDACSFAGCFYAFSEIVAALDHLIANQETLQVRAINMSLGTNALFSGICDQTTAFNMAGSFAINTLRSLGAVAVAASMNNGSSTEMASPACLENVLAVGAVTREDVVPTFSNGNDVTDLVAPGVQIRSLAVGGGVRTATGTSMAAPHAAGCAALLAQANPRLSADRIANRLRNSPVQVTDPRNGSTLPRLNCAYDSAPPDPATTTKVGRPGGSG